MANQQIKIKAKGTNYQVIEGAFENALYLYQNGQDLHPIVVSSEPIIDAGWTQDGHQWEAVRTYALSETAPLPPVVPVDESAALHAEIAGIASTLVSVNEAISLISGRVAVLEEPVPPVIP